jgi:glycosyltransferase involved in cell wall biosynthesis
MNGENYLHEAITSALKQDYPNIEIIIGVNPSTDRTLEIAKSFQGFNSIRILEFDEVVNMPANFNRTALTSTGEYIKFLCHDDSLPSNSINDLISVSIKSKHNVFAVGYESFVKSDREIRGRASFGSHQVIPGRTILRRIIKHNNWIGGPSLVLINSSLFFERQFDESLECAFDLDYWIYLATKGNLALSQKVVLNSRVHEYQATNKCINGGFLRDIHVVKTKMRKNYKIGQLNKLYLGLRTLGHRD